VSFRQDDRWLVGREYLRGATFAWRVFQANKYNDHEHCDLCSQTLDVGDEGYETTKESPHPDGGHYWLCRDCFLFSKATMGWTKVDG
jgi:hypothetical protein